MTMEIGRADYVHMPDYTDPSDQTRLRPAHVASPDHRWGSDADRDSTQATKVREMFTAMDAAVVAFNGCRDAEDALWLANDMAECWGRIRRTMDTE